MAHQRSGDARRWKRFAPGVVVTVLITLIGLATSGAEHRLELSFEDMVLWRTRPVEAAAPEITVIEIDDAALGRIEKWPWTWDTMAAIVDALSDLKARAVVLDIIYAESPGRQFRDASLAEFPNATPLDEEASVIRIDLRRLLADSIRRSGRTLLTYSPSTRGQVDDPLYNAIEAELVASPTRSPADVARRLGRTEADVRRFFLTARGRALEVALGREPGFDPADNVAAEKQFAKWFPALDYSRVAPVQDDFKAAVDYNLRMKRLFDSGDVGSAGGQSPFPQVVRVLAPLAELVGAAAGTGFARVTPDADGVIRRVPVAMACEGRLLPQLGLKAAMFARGAREFKVTARGDTARIEGDDGRVIDLPIDDKGRMIIAWSRGRGSRQDGFTHLPITKVYQYAMLLKNRRIYNQAIDFAAELSGKTAERNDLRRQLKTLRREGRDALAIDKRSKQLRRIEGRLPMALLKLQNSGRPKDMPLRRFQQAKAYAGFLMEYAAEIDRVEKQLTVVAAELREAVEDRLCFVGMTATSAALDRKPTPIHSHYPGVFAHATIADNVLRERFIRRAHWLIRWGLLILVGLAVTLVSGWLSALRATLASLLVLAIYLALSWGLFAWTGTLLLIGWPVVVGAISLLAIMVYRELTEGNRRRWITERFKQYTSEKMVDELVANPDFLVLGGQRRDMTVYFSDIAGFTSLSERLEAPQLVSFLQMYLEEMTDRLLEQDATLDKYEGDAVMAFFGAPISQEDHAARCLRAAVEHLRALPRLNKRFHAEGLLPEGRDLRVRIGISSGLMAVGNFGSRRRFDYTVIGDTVNLGARLEGVNRTFGTTVLFSGATRQQVGDEFMVRPIGPVRVVGRSEPVDVFELLDPEAPNADAGLEDYLVALDDFQGGWLNEARQKFEQVLKMRPDDGPTLAYLRRVDALLRDGIQGNPGPWDMTEK